MWCSVRMVPEGGGWAKGATTAADVPAGAGSDRSERERRVRATESE